MRIVIGADLVPTASNENMFRDRNNGSLIGPELEAQLAKADYKVFNCEVPLTHSKTPIDKSGPNIKASPEDIAGFVSMNVNFVTLGNNHIMDYGPEGMLETTKVFRDAGIAYAGVGSNREEAAQLYYTEIKGKRIGIYCCVEHEFSYATKTTAGANPFDPLYSLDHIEKLHEQCDLVIVLYHGGRELYQYPTPNLQERCRRMLDYGADIVLCQHSHCIGCMENYNNKYIIYGQGNFIFDRSDNPLTKEGLLVQIEYEQKINLTYIPIIMADGIANIPGENKQKEILEGFYKRSQQIQNEQFVEEQFEKLCESIMHNYLFSFHGGNIFSKVLNKITHGAYVRHIYRKKKALLALNNIQCEAHREVSLKAFQMVSK